MQLFTFRHSLFVERRLNSCVELEHIGIVVKLHIWSIWSLLPTPLRLSYTSFAFSKIIYFFGCLGAKRTTTEWICQLCLCSPLLTFKTFLNLYWGYVQTGFGDSYFRLQCINVYIVYLELMKQLSFPFCFMFFCKSWRFYFIICYIYLC